MTIDTRLGDLTNFEVEHLLSERERTGQVKLRAKGMVPTLPADGRLDVVLVGQVNPGEARKIANDLVEAAARAEYEEDLAAGLIAMGLDGDQVLAVMITAVRKGERARIEPDRPS